MSTFREIGRPNLSRYAGLALPLAFAGLPIYMLAPDFYATNLNLSLAVVGSGLLVLRLADALIDPLIGRGIDFFKQSASLVSAISAILLCLGFLMLFVPPSLEGIWLACWFFLSVFLVTAAFSSLSILYGATGALWSDDRLKQTLITSYREAATLIGLILSVSLPFALLEVISARFAYLLLVILFVALLSFFYRRYVPVQTAVLAAGEERGVERAAETDRASQNSQQIFGKDKAPISFLYLAYAVSALASAVPAVLVVFFVRDYLGSQGFVGIALVIYFLSGVLSMPIWHGLANRFGKLRAWQMSMMLAILSFTWVCLLSPGDYVFYAIVCLMSGAALGAEMALPPSILSEYLQGGESQSAAQKYAGLTMVSKLSLAAAAGICLPLLGAHGFEPGVINKTHSLTTLLILYGLVPGVLKVVALVVMQIWILKEREISNEIEAKSFTNIGSLSDG